MSVCLSVGQKMSKTVKKVSKHVKKCQNMSYKIGRSIHLSICLSVGQKTVKKCQKCFKTCQKSVKSCQNMSNECQIMSTKMFYFLLEIPRGGLAHSPNSTILGAYN